MRLRSRRCLERVSVRRDRAGVRRRLERRVDV